MSRANGRVTIIAHVGVDLPSHRRLLQIPRGNDRGAALGAWLAATCYARREETDGWCPSEALEGVADATTIDRLVSVGLFAPSVREGIEGYDVVRYSDFNETKADVDARLSKDRRRKKPSTPAPSPAHSDRIPSGIHSESDRIPLGHPPHLGDISGNGNGNGNGISAGSPGVQGGPVVTDTLPTDDMRFGFGASAWAEGVAKGSGVPCAAPDRFGVADLGRIAKAHAGGLRGAALDDWYRATGEEYGRTTDAAQWDRTPRRFGVWLDGGKRGRASPARAAVPRQQTPADAPWLKGL